MRTVRAGSCATDKPLRGMGAPARRDRYAETIARIFCKRITPTATRGVHGLARSHSDGSDRGKDDASCSHRRVLRPLSAAPAEHQRSKHRVRHRHQNHVTSHTTRPSRSAHHRVSFTSPRHTKTEQRSATIPARGGLSHRRRRPAKNHRVTLIPRTAVTAGRREQRHSRRARRLRGHVLPMARPPAIDPRAAR